MRWKPGQRSRNIEDRRAQTGRRGGGLRFPFPPMGRRPGGRMGGRPPKLSLGSIVILLIFVFFFRDELLQVLSGPGGLGAGLPNGQATSGPPAASSAAEEEMLDFVSFVLDDLQQTWTRLLPGYREAKLVLFRGQVRSGCGAAAAQMGPFYCPLDEKVYIDLTFYDELRRRFGAPGDFAQAYVLAHEVGHHVQKVTGTEPRVRRAQKSNPRQANELSVRMELQADCLAGVWGHSTAKRDILEPGDVEEAMRAASAIGDDNIQQQQTGRVRPESFTHGSSEQRMRWFRRGLETGDPNACDTFGGGA
jgi:predicted metalloprotease